MAVAALSTVVEWYDFTLYLYFATILSRSFFGSGAQALGEVLAGFAIAYLMRPLGAMVFGHMGDRHGRRQTLLLSMAMMTLAMLLTACLPTRAQAGPLAGGLLLGLRCVMGFSVGGEYTGVVAYLLEGAPEHRRGLVASLAAAASEVGGLLAVAVCAVTAGAMDQPSLDAWGWRIPFLIGALLAGGVWLARSSLPEPPLFEEARRKGQSATSPLRHALRHERAGIARGFAISALGSITYYVGITYVPAYLGSVGWRQDSSALGLSTLAAVVVIAVTPLIGLLSDHWGRKPVLLTLCAGSVVLPAAMFTLMASGDPLPAAAGACVLAALAGGVSAVGAVATAEQFSTSTRLSGLALGATSATALFGGAAPYAAHALLAATHWPAVPGALIALVALGVAPVLLHAPETARRASGGMMRTSHG
ncbi:MFS transporter [Novosphingobium sp.]|uniref:MFS transporter n=1 Tax=Novosphingobium sp. TaxID=1874826 RepID=UPI0031E18405